MPPPGGRGWHTRSPTPESRVLGPGNQAHGHVTRGLCGSHAHNASCAGSSWWNHEEAAAPRAPPRVGVREPRARAAAARVRSLPSEGSAPTPRPASPTGRRGAGARPGPHSALSNCPGPRRLRGTSRGHAGLRACGPRARAGPRGGGGLSGAWRTPRVPPSSRCWEAVPAPLRAPPVPGRALGCRRPFSPLTPKASRSGGAGTVRTGPQAAASSGQRLPPRTAAPARQGDRDSCGRLHRLATRPGRR